MRFYFEDAEIWMRKKMNMIQKINQSGLPLVLFGRSATANTGFLQDIIVPVQYICDNDPTKWGTRMWGLETLSPLSLEKIYHAYNVLILAPYEQEITQQLQRLSIPPAEIFHLDFYYEEEDTADYFSSMQREIESIYDHLADQESKDIYEALIHYRINRDRTFLRGADLVAQQYFPVSLGNVDFLHSDEVFVDVGAYTGDTIEGFLSAVHKQYRSIYAFEADPENYAELLKNTKNLSNLICRQVGVSDQHKQIRFTFSGLGSKEDSLGEQRIDVDALDDLLGNTPITYLKMDIEGMECAALRGARNLIQTYHPKLGICIYHSNADMIEVPKQILELNPDYQLYIRHYSNYVCETVCYAV